MPVAWLSSERDFAFEMNFSRPQNAPKLLASAGKELSAYPFLRHLAAREELVRQGKLSVIIFIRDRNTKGQEVSGYIDFGHRLKTENFEPYFERTGSLCWAEFSVLSKHLEGWLFSTRYRGTPQRSPRTIVELSGTV